MGKLDGKVALISGGARGQGAAEAETFAREGARVVFGDIRDDEGKKVEAAIRAGGGEATYLHLDVTSEADWRAAVQAALDRHGRLDVLVNNAAIVIPKVPIEDRTVAEWDQVMAVNAKGVFLCCKYGIPYLLKAGGGSVINVASFVALMGAATSQIAYTASKGAVLSMSRELAVQFARQGVRVNALCPGPVETQLLMRIFNADPGAYERRRVHLPMGRLARAIEIANAALFLASDESSYVNGATFLVDGGITAAYVTPE